MYKNTDLRKPLYQSPLRRVIWGRKEELKRVLMHKVDQTPDDVFLDGQEHRLSFDFQFGKETAKELNTISINREL